MNKIDAGFMDIGYIDRLSSQNTRLHQLDPRAKLFTALVFVTTVVSFHKYDVFGLFPFLIYPVFLCSVGNIPLGYILKKILIVSPFAIMVGIFNPFIDPTPLMSVGQLTISGGWVSFLSIMLRFLLTVGAALTLIGVTGFNSVCLASGKMGIPRIFVIQLMFLYRYLFVLTDEVVRMARAISLRSPFGKRSMSMKIFGSMLGHLLLRTLDRAQRIQLAMSCRGFDGEFRIRRRLRFNWIDACFVCFWSAYFILMRNCNITESIGSLVTEVLK